MITSLPIQAAEFKGKSNHKFQSSNIKVQINKNGCQIK